MAQTLYAVVALVIVTLFAFQQQRTMALEQAGMIRNEMAMQATGVGVDKLEEIGSRPYDEATRGEKKVSAASDLTPPPFEVDKGDNDDIDDFHADVGKAYRVAGRDTLWFWVRTTVSYASESDPEQPASTATKFKRATAEVVSLTVSLPDTITLSQSYACGSLCDW